MANSVVSKWAKPKIQFPSQNTMNKCIVYNAKKYQISCQYLKYHKHKITHSKLANLHMNQTF